MVITYWYVELPFPRTHLERPLGQWKTHYPRIILNDIQINMLPANVCKMYSSSTIHNLSDLNTDLSQSLKVKCDAAVGLSPYTGNMYIIC